MVPKCKCGDAGFLDILKRLVSAFLRGKVNVLELIRKENCVELAEKYIKNEPSTHEIMKKRNL